MRLLVCACSFGGIAAGQTAILQIKVLEGEGTVLTPGSRSAHTLTVAVADETGRPVAGAAVSFHLPEGGPGGTFASGLRTDIATTDARGRATVRALMANRTPGRFQIRIVASKEQARAGTVSFQYIGELKAGRAAPAAHRKWLVAAAIAGGCAVAGVLASRDSGGAAGAEPAGAPPVPPAVTIGAPSISVGKP